MQNLELKQGATTLYVCRADPWERTLCCLSRAAASAAASASAAAACSRLL